MKVFELITLLQRCDPNLEVFGVSDHGQTPEKVFGPSVIFVADNSVNTIWDGEYALDRETAKEYGDKQKAILL